MMRRLVMLLLLAGTGGCQKAMPLAQFRDGSASPGFAALGGEALALTSPTRHEQDGDSPPQAQAAAPLPQYQDATAPLPPPRSVSPGGGSAEPTAAVDTSRPARERIIIYTAQLTVSVVDVEGALASAKRLCDEAGGYMDAMTSESITMRVPAQRFNGVMDEIRRLGQVLSRNVNAQDVTDEYVDLQLRLKNAEVTRERLLAILQKAQTVKETLEVERELSRVREEIERIKGRLAVLDRQTAFSTITIHFTRPAGPQIARNRPPTPFAWLESLGVEHVLQLGR